MLNQDELNKALFTYNNDKSKNEKFYENEIKDED